MPKFSELFSTTAKVLLSLFLIALAMGVLYSIVAAGSMAAARSYLYAAYCATWLIHGVYLGSLVRRFNRLQRQMKDLQK